MIDTKRLKIRPLSYSELYTYSLCPLNLAKDLDLKISQSLIDEETKDAIDNDLLPNLSDPTKDSRFYTMWIIIEKSENTIIGGICFHGEPDENKILEVGYGIDTNYSNKGYATEAVGGLINWLKVNNGANALLAETERTNYSSIKVLQKNGFKVYNQDKNLIFKLNLKD
jgi:Acetyltransferases, including N-acetylases of ribosomal proteins